MKDPKSAGHCFGQELLAPPPRMANWKRKQKRFSEADVRGGILLKSEFPDPEGLLDTAFQDWNAFLHEMHLPDDGTFLLRLVPGTEGKYDSFRINISESECVITAANTEGIRRGIFFVEDMLLAADGPFLKQGTIIKKAWLKNRISRSVFSPVSSAPGCGELDLDDDFYPAPYLNRLAHEGINGLWLKAEFRNLCAAAFSADSDPGIPARLARLKRTVEKCRRYGIRIFLQTIEPLAWKASDPLLKKFPELGGAVHASGRICFCPSSELSRNFLRECTYSIFKAIPQLGGIINISIGEKATTCLSSVAWRVNDGLGNDELRCPRCRSRHFHQVMADSVGAMYEGMHRIAPESDFICWYYFSKPDDLKEHFYSMKQLPQGVTLMFNFEAGGEKRQLGKTNIAGDYWLSYIGPSRRFSRLLSDLPPGVECGAKIQTGCSHELATVPFIPVPGILYRKYKAMRKMNVTSVMQCWYFGNYPGVMNKAAGMLAFEDFKNSSERDFLIHLAAPDWGKNAPLMAELWQKMASAYTNYPFSNCIQYYGPFHDGITWPLYPQYQYLPLSPTWMPDFPASGDTIGECLEEISLADAEKLAGKLSDFWHHAASAASGLSRKYHSMRSQSADLGLTAALDIMFRSAYNIFKFYNLRSRSRNFTPAMVRIVREELENTRKMKKLCLADPRIGFHAETDQYRIHSENLSRRISWLKKILKTPLPEKSETLFKLDKEQHCETPDVKWSVSQCERFLKIKAVMPDPHKVDQIFATIQGKCETAPLNAAVTIDGKRIMGGEYTESEITVQEGSWQVEFRIPWEKIQLKDNTFRLAFTRLYVDGSTCRYSWAPDRPSANPFRLRIGYHLPQYMYSFQKAEN